MESTSSNRCSFLTIKDIQNRIDYKPTPDIYTCVEYGLAFRLLSYQHMCVLGMDRINQLGQHW